MTRTIQMSLTWTAMMNTPTTMISCCPFRNWIRMMRIPANTLIRLPQVKVECLLLSVRIFVLPNYVKKFGDLQLTRQSKAYQTNASSSTSRKTGSKKSSEPRSRARGGAQQTSSGSSSKRRKAPWNPDAYTYKGQTAKKNYSRSNSRGQGSSSGGGSNYRRSSAGSTGNKRKAPSKTPMPQIDLMPT